MKHTLTPSVVRATKWFILLFISLCVATILVKWWDFAPFEIAIFNAVNGLPDSLEPFFRITTVLGAELVLAPVLAILWWRRHYSEGMKIVIAGGGAYVISSMLKVIIDRPRVFNVLTDMHQRAFEVSLAYPSGHTTFASAIALSLAIRYGGRWWWVAAVWIGLVALSRMYLGVHTPLDIIAGICVGGMAAIFTQYYLTPLRIKALAMYKPKH